MSHIEFNPSSVTRSFNVSFQPSVNVQMVVKYCISISVSSALIGTNSGTVFLEVSPDNVSWTEVDRFSLSLAGVVSTQISSHSLISIIRRAFYVRLRTTTSGANGATFTYISGQEIQH